MEKAGQRQTGFVESNGTKLYYEMMGEGFVLNSAPMRRPTPPAVERLTEIRIPTLIVVGDEDSVVLHQTADKLELDVSHTTRVGIVEAHHMPNMEKSAEFNHIVLNFLRNR